MVKTHADGGADAPQPRVFDRPGPSPAGGAGGLTGHRVALCNLSPEAASTRNFRAAGHGMAAFVKQIRGWFRDTGT